MIKKYLTAKRYDLVSKAVSIIVTIVVKSLAKKGWKMFSFKKPPLNPQNKYSSTKEVLAFSIGMAILTAVSKVFARQGLSKGWSELDGRLPSQVSGS